MANSATRLDPMMAGLKVPPHSLEAEQAVLGGIMLDNKAWDKVIEHVVEIDFYRHDHQLIFQSMRQLAERNQPLDVVTLSESLAKHHKLEEAGGLAYLVELAKNTPSAANIAAYADIVRERSVLRQLITVAAEITEISFKPEGRSSMDLLNEAESKIFKIAEQHARGSGPIAVSTLLASTVDRIDELYHADSIVTGLATGYTDFDEMTAGLQPSDLIIVAGRPSMGKTTFAVNVLEHIAIASGKPVVVFSLEMPGESLSMRMLASLGRVDQTRIRTGKLKDEDWPRLTSAVNMLAETKLFIDDTPALGPGEMRARCRRLAREHGDLGLVVIDYLQLMSVPGFKENRTGEISEISRSLKLLAKELSVPVIALSQLNRELEHRPNKRPIMSDLRESGAIEQDADLVVFIYRDEVYNKDTQFKGTAEIIIGKQRNGPIGTVYLTFMGSLSRFENHTSDHVVQSFTG